MFSVALLSAVAATGQAQAPADQTHTEMMSRVFLCSPGTSSGGTSYTYDVVTENGQPRITDMKLQFGDGTRLHADEMIIQNLTAAGSAEIQFRGDVRLFLKGCE